LIFLPFIVCLTVFISRVIQSVERVESALSTPHETVISFPHLWVRAGEQLAAALFVIVAAINLL